MSSSSASAWQVFNFFEKSSCLVLDVRSEAEWEKARVWKALSFPVSEEAMAALAPFGTSPPLTSVAKWVNIPSLQKQMSARMAPRKAVSGMRVFVYHSDERTSAGSISVVSLLAKTYGFAESQLAYVSGGWLSLCSEVPFVTVGVDCDWRKGNEQLLTERLKAATHKTDALELDSAMTAILDDSLLFPTCILDGALFLGNATHAQMPEIVSVLSVSHVVNATTSIENFFNDDGVVYHRVAVEDSEHCHLKAHFDETADFIKEALATRGSDEEKDSGIGRVLVHCEMGVSRSSTLAIAYLMRHCGHSLEAAYGHCVERRPAVRPNTAFLKQLGDYETELRGAEHSTVARVQTHVREAMLSKMMAQM